MEKAGPDQVHYTYPQLPALPLPSGISPRQALCSCSWEPDRADGNSASPEPRDRDAQSSAVHFSTVQEGEPSSALSLGSLRLRCLSDIFRAEEAPLRSEVRHAGWGFSFNHALSQGEATLRLVSCAVKIWFYIFPEDLRVAAHSTCGGLWAAGQVATSFSRKRGLAASLWFQRPLQPNSF